jgi:hypothetical protein
MKRIVSFLLAAHPTVGWFKKESTSVVQKKVTRSAKISQSPDSYHSRSLYKKKDNPRPNPAP